jgi:hypothetical protein
MPDKFRTNDPLVRRPLRQRRLLLMYGGDAMLLQTRCAVLHHAGFEVDAFTDSEVANRQSEIYAREGVDLDRSTLAGWVGASAALLAPLVEAVRTHVLSATRLHADDTPVPVLAPGNGRTKAGRLWTYARAGRPWGDAVPPAVWFAFSPDPAVNLRRPT